MRIYIPLLVLAFSLPTQAAEALSATYTRWERLRDPSVMEISFAQGFDFLTDHPGWPEEKNIRLRTEAAALKESPSQSTMEKFCTNLAPISGRGMIACASAKVGTPAQQQQWIKQGWLQGDFNENEEDAILKTYSKQFTQADHIARTDRLLYEERTTGAKRMLSLVPAAKRQVFETRIAMIKDDKRAPKLLNGLSAADQRDPGMLFTRAQWRLKRGDYDGLAELVLATPKDTPYSDFWWPIRAIATREAMGKNNYTLALKLLSPHGELKGEALADALWLKGWILLRHRNDAANAYKEFFKLYTNVYTPVSKARAAYWAGRAAEANGNKAIATEWMEKAARRPTVFYGQLALSWLKPKAALELPAMPKPTDSEKQKFDSDELVIVARVLDDQGDERMRDMFLAAIANRTNSATEYALLSQLASKLGGTASGVEIAKLGLRNGVVLMETGWPKTNIPNNIRIEKALALAIIRQESEFNPTARSSANARGLMQLLPATAKQTARKLDMNYRDSMIDEPMVNITLGTWYLGQIIDGFDGSYILGIASYNAGPGSVRKWISKMGRPPKNLHGAIDWIESIPFGETRNYVMRALENVNVYRNLSDPQATLAIEKDLTR